MIVFNGDLYVSFFQLFELVERTIWNYCLNFNICYVICVKELILPLYTFIETTFNWYPMQKRAIECKNVLFNVMLCYLKQKLKCKLLNPKHVIQQENMISNTKHTIQQEKRVIQCKNVLSNTKNASSNCKNMLSNTKRVI